MSVVAAAPADQVPRYLRAAPSRVLGLRPWHWTLLLLVAGAIVVELVPRLGLVSRVTLLPFSEMVVAAGKLVVDPEFYAVAVLPSIVAILLAFVLASVLGILVGYVIWRVRPLRQAIDPYLTAYYALPIFAIYPALIAIWGQGAGPITALAVLFAIVAVITNAMNGFDSAPPIIGKLARSLDVSEWTYFIKFFLPYAMPYILIGLRLAFLYSLLSVLAAEFLLSSAGLGYFINISYVRFRIEEMYGAIIVVFALAILAERMITLAVRRLTWVGSLS